VSAHTAARAGAIRIVVVDDHTIVRQGLRSILELEPDFTVVGEAADADQAVTETERLRPDVVLLDLKLSARAPDEGLDVCEQLLARQPGLSIVVLTTFMEERLLLGALRRGASGYALKDVDAVELARIIRSVYRGDSAFDPHSAQLVVRSITGRPITGHSGTGRPTAGGPATGYSTTGYSATGRSTTGRPDSRAAPLSNRELSVVRLVAGGATNPRVATELYISVSTVKYHLRSAMSKLGARDRAELVYRASAMGLL
jgi:two-component system, NarL family, response regulator DevR